MYYDLTKGKISKSLIMFTIPMIAGDLLQQFYNIADTLIVGQVLGKNALAAVGSAYTLMIFLTSIFLGLSMGAGALFSIYRGNDSDENLRIAVGQAFSLIMLVTIVLNIAVYILINPIMIFLQVPDEVYRGMKIYLLIIFIGLIATSLYNFFSCLLRALGNSLVPLIFLAVSTVLNIGLDLLFVVVFPWGIKGAAIATVISQYVSAIGIVIYVVKSCRELLPKRSEWRLDKKIFKEIINLSSLTCLQQSVMNFGILMVQGLVNSFGTTIMAAFTAGVKIDPFAYLPVQDFGNAFSIFIAQNYGARQPERIKKGIRTAVITSLSFGLLLSILVCLFAAPLMSLFIDASETAVIAEGVRYLHIEGAFYFAIGGLFLLYGLYRALAKPGMSVVLTIISLGTRVALAYALSAIPSIGVVGIWWSVPIGWFLADALGVIYYILKVNNKDFTATT